MFSIESTEPNDLREYFVRVFFFVCVCTCVLNVLV